ncbi:hypothetical protein ACFX13_025723 [Malus domestica]
MGNIFSVSIPCDPTANFCCWAFLSQQANYISKLGESLEALDRSLQELTILKNDLVRRVEVAELQTSMMRLDQVQLWIKIVRIKKFKNHVAAQRTTLPAIMGIESMFDEVWRHVEDEQVGTIRLYGMRGVGKTTLLTKIHNKFALSTSYHFDPVIWIVVSKDHKLEILQDKIGEKLGILNDKWKDNEPHEKAQHIFKFLSKKKYVLLLDDIWETIEMTTVGIHNPEIPNPVTPGPANNKKSKIIFTNRLEHICSCVDAQIKMKVTCLMPNQAWTLFQEKVGKETIQSHPDIPKLAQVVANECDGLPLAIITVGRAMTCKKTPHEWKHGIRVLKESASECSMMGDMVFPLLKFSYDILPTCDSGKENESILVHTGLLGTPNVKKWKKTKRVSLVGSDFESLVETPKSPNLLTLLLRGGGGPLNMIADGFFNHMPTLGVLDLSENLNITKLPSGVSNLISLQHLNLSRTGLRKLPIQLKACVRLKYLDLEHMDELVFVPPNLISSFPVLKVLRTLACGSSDRIHFDGEGALVEEIQGLKYLEVLTLSVRSSSCFQKLFSYHKLVTRIRTLQLSDGKNQASFLDISSLVDMKHLDTLYIRDTPNWKRLEVYWAGRAPNDPRDLMMI